MKAAKSILFTLISLLALPQTVWAHEDGTLHIHAFADSVIQLFQNHPVMLLIIPAVLYVVIHLYRKG